MRKFNVKPILLLFIFALLTQPLFSGMVVLASTPYRTFTMDRQNNLIETQTAYLPIGRINLFGDLRLSSPADMVIVDDMMFIADTGNQRIVVADLEGNLIRTFGEDVLSSPQGIFVTRDHRIYVADETNLKVHVFNGDGELLEEFGRPDHPLFGDTAPFVPQKLVVDQRQNIYIISRGNTNGIIQLSQANHGEFLGYFGVNPARTTLMGFVRNILFTEEQREQLFPTIPPTTTNLALDDRGLIHTITAGDLNYMLKRLNMAGNNMLGSVTPFYDPTGIVVGPIGNIFVATASGHIIEYTRDGEVLFVFGGMDRGEQRMGLFNTVSAIALDSDHRLYVMDARNNEVQIFERTEFAVLLHDALALYQDGFYQESMGPWNQVLQMNSLFDLARAGLGEALYYEGRHLEAMAAFRRGLEVSGYSNAFWEVRNEWMRENLTTVFGIAIGIFVLLKLVAYGDKKKGWLAPVKAKIARFKERKLVRELNYIWYFIKHPVDGYYGIRFENKTSWLSTTIWLVVMIALFLLNRYQSGFLFRLVLDGNYQIGLDVLILLGAFLFMLSSHYLVSTITGGEGKVRDVYSGVVYSFVPYLFLIPFATVLSNVLTLNEAFLLTLTYIVAYGWIGVLLIIMIKEIHNYSIWEVTKNILITIFTALLFVLIGFILYVLFMQFYNFIVSIIGEVVHRFGNTI